MGGASAFIDHADAIGSTTMETDPAGAVQWKIAYYPWGQILAQGGTRQSVVWAGLDWQVNDPSYPSATREYNDGLGRWLTPDPAGMAGVGFANPQSWNMYSYVLNNPTSLTDPEGTDVYVCFKNENGGQDCNWYSTAEYSSYAAAQNAADQGITAPVANDQNGDHPNGNIMCGSSVCGTVTYGEAPSQDVTDSLVNLGLAAWGLGRASVSFGAGLVEGAFNRLLGTAGEEATSAIVGGATAYPTEIAGYKVSEHVFERMAQDLGHRVPSQVVEDVIQNGQTLAGKTADVIVKYSPTANINGVTVAIKQSTREIIMIRVGRP